MKYKDILDDVLAGKWFRLKSGCDWVRMDENGRYENMEGTYMYFTRNDHQQDTWGVKPEDTYVWGATDDNGNSFLYAEKPTKENLDHFYVDSGDCMQVTSTKQLPKDKPQKYKLVPVEEDEK